MSKLIPKKTGRDYEEEEMQKRLLETISPDMTSESLKEYKTYITKIVRDRNSTRNRIKGMEKFLLESANKFLASYEQISDNETLNKILEEIANEIIRSHRGEILDDLADLEKTYKKMGTIYKIHSRVLIDGRMDIPKNFSSRYLQGIIETRFGQDMPDNILYDEKIVDLLQRMGETFVDSSERYTKYIKIIEEFVIDQLKNNPDLKNDPKINSNPNIVKIVVQYARALSMRADKSQLEVNEALSLINTNFSEYISGLLPRDQEFINSAIGKFSPFKLRYLKKDITDYQSFDEFMENAQIKELSHAPVEEHVPNPLPIVNHKTKTDNVMSNDNKFKAIQKAIVHLRETNPNITVGNVLIGYQDPFKGYIIFPLEKTIGDIQQGKKEIDSEYGTNIAISDVFSNVKGGALYVMNKNNIEKVFSVENSEGIIQNNGPATRTIAKRSIPGVVTVHHYTQQGMDGYQTMVNQAVDNLIANPDIIDKEYKVPNKTIKGVKGTKKRDLSPKINFEDVKKAPKTVDNDTVKEYMSATLESMQEEYRSKTSKPPCYSILDYCLRQMVFEGMTLYSITEQLAKEHNQDSFQMFNYVRANVAAANDMDKSYVTKSLVKMYRKEIKALNRRKQQLSEKVETKTMEEKQLRENIMRTKEFFSR